MPTTAFRPLGLVFSALAAAASAAAQSGPPLDPGTRSWSIVTAAVVRSAADLDGGGDLSARDARLELGLRQGLTAGRTLGTSLAYQVLDYDFAGRPGAPADWGAIEQLDLGLSYSHPFDRSSALFLAPSLGFSAEAGGLDGDSLRYGGIFGYSRQLDPSLTLGGGAGVFLGLEDSSVFPVIFVRWQITDDWRLGNPFRPGPAGPAGLELTYTGLDRWELGFGASYRTQRFKLDAANPVGAAYGEDRGAAVFVRATRSFGPGTSLDLFVGTVFGGELRWDDVAGRPLVREDYDPAPLAALAFTAAF